MAVDNGNAAVARIVLEASSKRLLRGMEAVNTVLRPVVSMNDDELVAWFVLFSHDLRPVCLHILMRLRLRQ